MAKTTSSDACHASSEQLWDCSSGHLHRGWLKQRGNSTSVHRYKHDTGSNRSDAPWGAARAQTLEARLKENPQPLPSVNACPTQNQGSHISPQCDQMMNHPSPQSGMDDKLGELT